MLFCLWSLLENKQLASNTWNLKTDIIIFIIQIHFCNYDLLVHWMKIVLYSFPFVYYNINPKGIKLYVCGCENGYMHFGSSL